MKGPAATERPPLKRQTVANRSRSRRTKREGARERPAGMERKTRKDGWTDGEGIIWRVRGRGKASFYRGRHLPTDRHYRTK